MKPPWAWGALAGAGGTLLLLLLILLITVYTGGYNVAATQGHTPFTRWAFSTDMRNAVAVRAGDTSQRPDFTAAMVATGASEYKAMCAHCHAGPGVERAAWAEGMLPLPPHLVEHAGDWSPEEIHWIVRHGIKMTGMPAFGPSHGNDTIWNIVAFVKALPAMSPQQYSAFPTEHSHGGAEHSHGGAEHSQRAGGAASQK